MTHECKRKACASVHKAYEHFVSNTMFGWCLDQQTQRVPHVRIPSWRNTAFGTTIRLCTSQWYTHLLFVYHDIVLVMELRMITNGWDLISMILRGFILSMLLLTRWSCTNVCVWSTCPRHATQLTNIATNIFQSQVWPISWASDDHLVGVRCCDDGCSATHVSLLQGLGFRV